MSKDIAADIGALLRARNPVIWIVSREEARVERTLVEVAASVSYQARMWDIAQGFTDMNGTRLQGTDDSMRDPGEALTQIANRARNPNAEQRAIWIMRDLPIWLNGITGASPLRQLRNLARLLPGTPRKNAQAIIIITPIADIPAELSGHATVVDWPLPDRDAIAAVLDAALDALPEEMRATAAPNGVRDAAIDAAVGLSGEEAASCYSRSLVVSRTIDPTIVAQEKKRVVAREKVIEWYDPIPGGLDAVGGLENLKAWLDTRRSAYSPEARAYGLPAPKGAMIVGVSGCGKSLTCKAVATAWGVPLLRLDLGSLKSKFVGESEGNIRKAWKVIEAIGRCVVWIDEIEKALQGATSGSADGGVSSDALGSMLTFMQERQGESFVIATANDISGLPPEFLRKGRFDEIWFVDLPTGDERQAVLAAALRAHKRDKIKIDLGAVSEATHTFTGAEIAAIVPDALFAAFNDGGREITTEDLLKAAATVVPLNKTAGEKIAALRAWGQTRARPASNCSEDFTTKAVGAGRRLDIV